MSAQHDRASNQDTPVSRYALPVSFDPNVLLLSLVTGGIGFVLLVYGKKQDRWPQLVAGLVLMVYPYFVSGVAALVGVAVAICAALWLAVRQGW